MRLASWTSVMVGSVLLRFPEYSPQKAGSDGGLSFDVFHQ